MQRDIHYTQGLETSKRVAVERYTPSRPVRDLTIVFLAGTNVMPSKTMKDRFHGRDIPHSDTRFVHGENYFGNVPMWLAQEGYKTAVVYSLAMSEGHPTGLYTPERDRDQLHAALEVAGTDLVYLVMHSWTTLMGLRLISDPEQTDHRRDLLEGSGFDESRIMDPALTAMLGNAYDVLTIDGKERTVPGLPFLRWLKVFELCADHPLLQGWQIPTYPVSAQGWHDGPEDHEHHKYWGASPWVNTTSASAFIPFDGKELARAIDPESHAHVMLTKYDLAGSFPVQQDMFHDMKERAPRITGSVSPTGHRWQTSVRHARDQTRDLGDHIRREMRRVGLPRSLQL